jgi:hypothetical protein
MRTMQTEIRYYGFSAFVLGAKAIVDLLRGSAGMADEPWDMHRPAPRRRRGLFAAKPKRITLTEFIEIAAYRFGWEFHYGSCDILDLGNGLRQAAVDRDVTIYGRTGCLHMPQTYWDNFPLQPIPAEHLCKHWVDLTAAMREDNHETKTYAVGSIDHGAAVYVDLWINREEGLKWLRREGREWRGRSDARQGGPESMRQAIWEQLESGDPVPASEPLALEEPFALDEPLPFLINAGRA